MSHYQVNTRVELEPSTRDEAERALIGLLLENPKYQVDIFDGFTNPEFIEDEQLRSIFTAALVLHKAGRVVDALAVKSQIEDTEGHAVWFNQFTLALVNPDTYPSSIPNYKRLIVDGYRFSEFKQAALKAQTLDDVDRVAIEALNRRALLNGYDEPSLEAEADHFVTKQEAILRGEIQAGYSLGVPEIDEHMRLQPGAFYTVGGLKKAGKTQFLLSILDHNLSEDPPVPVLMFSLEMTTENVLKKLIARRTDINSRRLHTRHIEEREIPEIRRALDDIIKTPLCVNQSPSMSIADVVARTRAWKQKGEIPRGTGIVAVDFLQLVRYERRRGQNEASVIKEIAYDLARLAKELRVVVVALSQFSNAAEGQKPSIRFLEGSGGIAQASEGILLLDLHHRRKEEYRTDRAEKWDDFDVIIIQRNGESGRKIPLSVDLKTSVFCGRNTVAQEEFFEEVF